MSYFKFLFATIISLTTLATFSQKKELTAEQLLKNKMPAITKSLPAIVSWDADDKLIIGRKLHPDSIATPFIIDPKTGKETITPKQERKPDTAKRVYSKENDVYFKDGEKPEVKLTNDKIREYTPTLSPDNNSVAYTKMHDLYVMDIQSKKETRLTSDGNDSLLNGYASWVYTEEILGRASQYRAFWWSPDSKHIAFFRTDDSPVKPFTITDATGQHGYVETVRYPKVGDKNPELKIGIVHMNDFHITWADFNAKDDQYFGMPYWKPDGSSLLQPWINRDQNNYKLYEVNPNSGTKKEFYDEKQKTWIDLDDLNRVTFLKNGKAFIMLSDKSGWRHMYYYAVDGKLMNSITTGKFTVSSITKIDEAAGIVYFVGRGRENSARNDFYSVGLNGKDLKRLTFGDYNHTVRMSPSGVYFITMYSNSTTPTRMAFLDNKGKKISDLGDIKGPDFDTYNWAKTELIRVKSDDGLFDLPALVTWPVNMDPTKKYPMLISVYGGPNADDVDDRWGFSANQQWYAKEGIIQVAMDHRGSGQFGKEGVNYMYHNLGYWEMKDYSTIVKHLIEKGQADPKKICITGFSYGGYMACYALTYGADVFTHGMAGGSVTDWTFYDTHYTEKFMGTPANNPEGYKTSSVLNYVDRYKGMLQIVHGVIDDNVHLQNSIALISKLQDQKKDFEFMMYSGGRHGWGGAKGQHFTNLRTKFIYRYLLEKPVPTDLLR